MQGFGFISMEILLVKTRKSAYFGRGTAAVQTYHGVQLSAWLCLCSYVSGGPPHSQYDICNEVFTFTVKTEFCLMFYIASNAFKTKPPAICMIIVINLWPVPTVNNFFQFVYLDLPSCVKCFILLQNTKAEIQGKIFITFYQWKGIYLIL